VLLVCAASLTDLRRRRIPNWLTFPAMLIGLGLFFALGSWKGFLLGLCGGLLAPALLLLLHAGRGIGMGDLKLVAALGCLLGPALGIVAVLVSAAVGGAMAGVIVLAAMHDRVLPAWLGRKATPAVPVTADRPAPLAGALTMPYGVAIAIGTLITVTATSLGGGLSWLL
jgi:prepilin peptidase CpaA